MIQLEVVPVTLMQLQKKMVKNGEVYVLLKKQAIPLIVGIPKQMEQEQKLLQHLLQVAM